MIAADTNSALTPNQLITPAASITPVTIIARPPQIIRPQFASYVLTATNAVQYAFLNLTKNVGRKFLLFPGVNQTGGGPLSLNAQNISVGIVGDGPPITPFLLQPGLPVFTVELPIKEDEVTALNQFICYGTNGDGFTLMYWP